MSRRAVFATSGGLSFLLAVSGLVLFWHSPDQPGAGGNLANEADPTIGSDLGNALNGTLNGTVAGEASPGPGLLPPAEADGHGDITGLGDGAPDNGAGQGEADDASPGQGPDDDTAAQPGTGTPLDGLDEERADPLAAGDGDPDDLVDGAVDGAGDPVEDVVDAVTDPVDDVIPVPSVAVPTVSVPGVPGLG